MSEIRKIGIVDEDGSIRWARKKKLPRNWKIPALLIAKVILSIATIIACIAGMIFIAAEMWYRATTAWTIGFFLMFLLWAFEYQMRRSF